MGKGKKGNLMGSEESTPSVNQENLLALLVEKDYPLDSEFWEKLFANPQPSNYIPKPFYIYEIANKQPQNITVLVEKAVKLLENHAKSDKALPSQIAWILNLVNMILSVLVQNTKFSSLLNGITQLPEFNFTINIEESDSEPKKARKKIKSNTNSEYSSSEEEEYSSEKSTYYSDGYEEDEREEEEDDGEEKPSKENMVVSPKLKISDFSKDEVTKAITHEQPTEASQIENQEQNTTFSRYLKILYALAFKRSLTSKENAKEQFSMPEFSVIHSILIVYNLKKIASIANTDFEIPPDLPDFPLTAFIDSTLRICTIFVKEYRSRGDWNPCSELLKNCFALASTLVGNPQLIGSCAENSLIFEGIDKQIASKAFIPYLETLLTEPGLPLSAEFLTFLYIILLCVPDYPKFIAESASSNLFVMALLQTMQITMEKVGVSFFHSVLLSSLMLIVGNDLAAACLNEPFGGSFISTFRPHRGTHADLLVEVLVNLSDTPSLINSVLSVLTLVADEIDELSLFSSSRLMSLLEKVISDSDPQLGPNDGPNRSVGLAVEFMARVAQKRKRPNLNLMVVACQKAIIFKKLEPRWVGLDIVTKYIAYAKTIFSKEGKKKLGADEARRILANIDISSVIPAVRAFDKHQHAFSGEMKKTWNDWTALLFARCSQKEFEMLKMPKMSE